MIQIKHRYTEAILFESAAETMRANPGLDIATATPTNSNVIEQIRDAHGAVPIREAVFRHHSGAPRPFNRRRPN